MDPDKLKLAAEEFDAGRRAYKLEQFARAAVHFENAFRDAPSTQALRMAIRSRRQAGELARAATLCVRAQALYPDDPQTVQLAQSVLRDTSPKLQKVTVQCAPACSVILDDKLVRDDAATMQVFFAHPGNHTVVAGWGPNRADARTLEAKEGSATVLRFDASLNSEEPVTSAPPSSELPPTSAPPGGGTRVPQDGGRGGTGGAPPTLFWLGTAVTSVAAGFAIWSGIDTVNNPGKDKVREACVGLGDSCPEYEDGLRKEARTNARVSPTWDGRSALGLTALGQF
ncbi:MAG: tetratricopeptide repeat protein [Polyangiaceae bacterium]|nr:tetratricopeptide repeat protein [Polyangiaceae bacterium]